MQPPAAPVGTSAASRRNVPVYLWGLGNVQPYNSVTIRAQVDGQITKIGFNEGQEVRVGDLLVEIDPRSYRASLEQAIAKRGQDQAQLDNARRDLQRHAKLVEKNYVARQQVDASEALVAQLEALVKGDEAAIENAKVTLGYATIRSPIDGRVGIRLIDKGNIVHGNDAVGIVTVTQTRPISLLFTLPEDALQGIVQAMANGPLPVAALSRDGQRQLDVGTLTLIDNAVDQATGTIKLKATLPNSEDLLWPGQFVKARLHVGTLRGVVTIPLAALQSGPDGSFAYVVRKDATAEVRKLQVGPPADDVAVVEKGLEEGEIVVTSGQYRLQPDSRVAATPEPSDVRLVTSKRD